MPTYVYRREDGTLFEAFQRITDAPLTKDPETGQKVTRVITGGAGLQFKGTGFYLTDYARKGQSEQKEGSGKSEPKTGAKAEKKDSEPAAKNKD